MLPCTRVPGADSARNPLVFLQLQSQLGAQNSHFNQFTIFHF